YRTALISDDLQPETGQLQVSHDLRPEQRADIGAVGVQEAWRELPAGSRTADPIVLFHHQHIQPGALQVAGVNQPVMAATHDDRVPSLHAGPAISTALHLP